MASPSIPPRPSRSQNALPGTSSSLEAPKIPPRPKRGSDRSVSPNRYAPSPLNDPSFLHDGQHRDGRRSTDLPPRPPSVTLPSIGQEGSEYASLDDLHKTTTNEQDGSPQQTKNVAGDLPLYAPKASVPSSTAKTRIQTVTRTDSSQAAAAGIGGLAPDDRSSGLDSGRSDSSQGKRSRPGSMYKDDEEQGIPVIGVQVPMYPNAGDVQAPTPSPYEQGASTGIGFHNKGGHPSGRHHGRTKSGREIFHGPPGSYGMHGHGVLPKTEFEHSWYAKHPEELKREKAGEYGPHIQENRKDYHWVGDDLVKLVHGSSSKGHGMGTSREAIGTPDEHVGYMASDEFASRMASPKPSSGRPGSISSQSAFKPESPLRQTNFPAGQLSKQKTQDHEVDDDVIHIDPPSHRESKIGGAGYDPPTEDLGPEGGNTEEGGGWVSERGYGVPILASDEIKKNPHAEWRQPAVSPELERRGSGEYTANDPDSIPSYITKQRTHSRGSSRNNSMTGIKAPRFGTPNEHERGGSPLESHKEYEPLFPEDDEHQKKPKTAADKLKRPDYLARHHFPSQDVWEDTPSSLQLETTVETPQGPEDPKTPGEADGTKLFEKPESEQARKEETNDEDQKSFLPERNQRFANKQLHKEHLEGSGRPGPQQRFPSHDIWEDAPDHGQLVTTVSTPQTEDTSEYADDAPATEKPTIPARPSVPARPGKAKEFSPVDKKAPVLPDRPKPQVPARPAKPLTKSSEKVPTLESQSAEPPQPKPKPAVPARPGGSKIAALQAGFLKDLNSKLGIGPQAPKVKEPEPENEEEAPAPLQDARKGRAKGPQRRKPRSSPSPAAAAATVTAEVAVPRPRFEISSVSTIWSIGDDGDIDVPAAKMAAKIQAALKPLAKSEPIEEAVEKEPDAVKEVVDTGDAVPESEESDLARISTKESTLSATEPLSAQSSKLESEPVSAQEPPVEDSPLEKQTSIEPQDPVSATEKAKDAVAADDRLEPTEAVESVQKAEGETARDPAAAV